MSVGCIEGSVNIDRGVRYPVPKRDIEETKREVESDLNEAATQLRSVFLFHSRPKRPPPDDDDDDEASVLRYCTKKNSTTFEIAADFGGGLTQHVSVLQTTQVDVQQLLHHG